MMGAECHTYMMECCVTDSGQLLSKQLLFVISIHIFLVVVEEKSSTEQIVMTTVQTFGTMVLTMRTLWNDAGEEFTGMFNSLH